MSQDRGRLGALLFGQSRRVSDWFLALAGAIFLGLVLLRMEFGADELNTLLLSEYVYAVAVGVVTGVSAVHAYVNSGVATSIVLAYVVTEGFLLGGWIALGTTGGDSLLPELVVLAVPVAGVLGTLGFVLGASANALRERLTASGTA